MKVNLIVFALDEQMGSEPGSGWAALRAHLSLKREVRIFTSESNRKNFEISGLNDHPDIEVIYISENTIFKKFPASQQIKYHIWILKVTIALKKILRNAEVDEIVHHATYGGDWNLTPLLFLRRDQKTFWGPIGGCQQIKFNEFLRLNFNGKTTEITRFIILNPLRVVLRRILAKKNATILTTNSDVTRFFGKRVRSIYCPNLILERINPKGPSDKRIIYSSGRLIPLKNFELQINAMKFVDSSYKLIIAGNGSEKVRLEKLIAKLELGDRVKIMGELPRARAIELLKDCSVFAFSSIRDSHSWSLAEAVHLGIPVATIGTPGNIAVIMNGKPSYLPERSIDPQKFSEYLMNPIQFENKNCFSLESLTAIYKSIFV